MSGVLAEEVFPPQDLEVRGEGFVQPDVTPRPAGEEIAEPLMGELVGEEPPWPVVLVRLLVREAVLGQGRHRRVLHAADDELGDADLRIPWPRILLARDFGEVADHVRDVPEGPIQEPAETFRHVRMDRYAVRVPFLRLEIADYQGDQVV